MTYWELWTRLALLMFGVYVYARVICTLLNSFAFRRRDTYVPRIRAVVRMNEHRKWDETCSTELGKAIHEAVVAAETGNKKGIAQTCFDSRGELIAMITVLGDPNGR